jgi:hypothetical protein
MSIGQLLKKRSRMLLRKMAPKYGKMVEIKRAGRECGLSDFLSKTAKNRSTSHVALSQCLLLVIHKEDFIKISDFMI